MLPPGTVQPVLVHGASRKGTQNAVPPDELEPLDELEPPLEDDELLLDEELLEDEELLDEPLDEEVPPPLDEELLEEEELLELLLDEEEPAGEAWSVLLSVIVPFAAPSSSTGPPSVTEIVAVLPLIVTPLSNEQLALMHFS